MSEIKIHGYLPTAGEALKLVDNAASARNLGEGVARSKVATGSTYRPATFDYMTQIAMAAENMGYESVLVPISGFCEDAWVTSSMLAARTTKLKFMVAFRPGLQTPVTMAQMCSTFQRYSGGRLMLNVTPGIPGPTSNRFGDWQTKEGRLEQAGEFLTVLRGSWSGEPFDFEGKYIKVKGASVNVPDPLPTIFYGGSSEASMRFAARYADVYMSYTEPPDMVTERLARVKAMAAEEGRTISCALSFGVIARETADEAWKAAAALLEGFDLETIRASAATIASQGYAVSGARQRLFSRLTSIEDAVIAPNMWLGQMFVRPGTGPVMVGSYDEVADRMYEMIQQGADEFNLLSNSPELESCYRFGEHVLPLLRARLDQVAA